MMDTPAVAANFRRLKEIGVELIDPRREEDKAKMADIETIAARAIRRLGPRDLAGMHVLVVTGATIEPIDDIRIVTNRSTGGTGIELAKVAFEHGAEVELWLRPHQTPGPTSPPHKPFPPTPHPPP